LETLDIYAPLAERMGLRRIKEELEDLAFAELNPDVRLSLLSRLKFLRAQDEDFVTIVCQELEALLKGQKLMASVFGREKTPYSIWRKMQRKSLLFEQLSDIMAFRILVDEIPTCYQVLGILHSRYAIVPGRFKDYISLPRHTHYRSLHTTLIGPLQRRIEVQIRTHDMEKDADLGIAAHWQYKQGFQPEKNHYQWIRELLDMLEHAHNPEEFLEHTKLEMFPDQVFCFTPKGNLITLPRGATPLDFAYAVHSRVGNTCVGSKINGRLVPLRTSLNNGDQVEILTSQLQKPSAAWEHLVVTAKARSHIRRFMRQTHQTEMIEKAQALLEETFQQAGLHFRLDLVTPHLQAFSCGTPEEFLLQVAKKNISPQGFLCQLFPEKAACFQRHVPPKKTKKLLVTLSWDVPAVQGGIPGMEGAPSDQSVVEGTPQ
jgi:GTP pyrophosphokinase